jgi:hypothetical protein
MIRILRNFRTGALDGKNLHDKETGQEQVHTNGYDISTSRNMEFSLEAE